MLKKHSFSNPAEVLTAWHGLSESQRLAAMLVVQTDNLTPELNPGIMTERTLKVLAETGKLNDVNAATKVQPSWHVAKEALKAERRGVES